MLWLFNAICYLVLFEYFVIRMKPSAARVTRISVKTISGFFDEESYLDISQLYLTTSYVLRSSFTIILLGSPSSYQNARIVLI